MIGNNTDVLKLASASLGMWLCPWAGEGTGSTLPPTLCSMRLCCVQCWAPHYGKDIGSVSREGQWSCEGSGALSDGEQMREWGWVSLEKRMLREDLIALCSDLKGCCGEVGSVSAPRNSDRTRGDGLKLHEGRFRLDSRGSFLLRRSGDAMTA